MSSAFDPALQIGTTFNRVAPEVVAAAGAISTATLHEAAGISGDLPPRIKPAVAGFALAGPAITVACPNGDNLWIHRAIYVAQPGDVLVVQPREGAEFGYWGEILSITAQSRKLAGLVIDGCVRDAPMLRDLGFPVFSRGLCIRGTVKDLEGVGAINATLEFGHSQVQPGDLIVGDEDGVVVIARSEAAKVVELAKTRDAKEAVMCEKLRAGATSLELLGLR